MEHKDYRYTECGLDNVLIRGMAVCTDDAGDEVYCISNILGLHKVIAYCILTHSQGISPSELRFLRTEMGLTQGELGEIVNKDHQTIGRWERGECPIDPNAEFRIRVIAAERLGIDTKLRLEEVSQRCLPSAKFAMIEIDGSNPEAYRPLAA